MLPEGGAAGFFISVEGVDGCGKTGIVQHLRDELGQSGFNVIATREPGGTSQGEALRALLLAGADDAWDPASELLLMTAARVEHVRRVIGPVLAAGKIVISDRFIGSTIAYQGAGRGTPETFIRDLHAKSVGPVWPDLTIVLDLDVEVGLARSRKRLQEGSIDEGRFEALDLDFHQRIRKSYLHQAEHDPDRHIVIDASGTPEQTRQGVLHAVRQRLPSRPYEAR